MEISMYGIQGGLEKIIRAYNIGVAEWNATHKPEEQFKFLYIEERKELPEIHPDGWTIK